MTSSILKIFSSLILPNGLLLLIAISFLQWVASPESLSGLIRVYPYAVLGVGLFLGWRFHRTWLIFSLLVLTLADRALLHCAAGPPAAGSRILFNSISLLLPLNLAALSLTTQRERGILTSRNLITLALILFQFLLAMGIYRYCPTGAGGEAIKLKSVTGPITWSPVSQSGLLAFGLAFLLLTARFLLRRGAIESGFFWALIASFLGLNVNRIGDLSTFYFSTAGLILVASFIETSYSMAYRDELTSLPSRRALNEALLQLGNRYTIAMVDIDQFKQFNDRHGHEAGDQVLRMVASQLEMVSGGGRAFRYGGEEFAVIFPGKSLKEALPPLVALHRAIPATNFTLRGKGRPRKRPEVAKPSSAVRKQVPITVSIGVAERDAKYTEPDQVIRAADRALYRAKEGGRNQISI
ncbi:MAG: GGDEF domain-containing protein [bacterium]